MNQINNLPKPTGRVKYNGEELSYIFVGDHKVPQFIGKDKIVTFINDNQEVEYVQTSDTL